MSATHPRATAATPAALALMRDLAEGEVLAEVHDDLFTMVVVRGRSDVWLAMRDGAQGLAVRLLPCPGGCDEAKATVVGGTQVRVRAASPGGRLAADVRVHVVPIPTVEWTSCITPSAPLRLPVRERDLFPLGRGGDPRRAEGRVEAAQRGLNTALVYLGLEQGPIRTALYVQDLTRLNPFLAASHVAPDGVMGGEWPELGLLLGSSALGGKSEAEPLAEGTEVVISRGILAVDSRELESPQHSAERFIELLGAVYPLLDRQPPEYHDWMSRAAATVTDLATSPKVRTTVDRHTYIRPYVDAQPPDVMVQASLAAALVEFGQARDDEPSLALGRRLAAGLPAFYDATLHTLRRFLPGHEDGKDADAVDSWYLYHPMLSLGRLAKFGDEEARRIFLDSLGYAVDVARHFDYNWPIQYRITDWSVIDDTRGSDGYGQTDTPGIYAYVMLQAFEFTGDTAYVDEAIAAIDASVGARFELNYQSNLTAWGAAACLRLWRITGQERHFRQVYVYLASYLHNCRIWESELGHARHYRTFFSPTCLHDAVYMAPYEVFDGFLAFEEVLRHGGTDLSPYARYLISEHCAYALEMTWWAYPDTLPAEALATTIRDGHIDPTLSLPLEDVYIDGQPAGQVGQEAYGAGAALAFARRMYRQNPEAPFELFCDRFVSDTYVPGTHTWSVRIDSPGETPALLALVRRSRRSWDTLEVSAAGARLRPTLRSPDRWEFRVESATEVTVHWA